MIDVVFVIMLFFMVMAGAVKVERELRMKLPSGVTPDGSNRLPDAEILLGVHQDGSVTMNEEPFDSDSDKRLPSLTSALQRLASNATRDKASVLATVEAEQEATYARVIDVMNVLQRASIADVTVAIGEE
jgi:biopolymer transport protein ExbD